MATVKLLIMFNLIIATAAMGQQVYRNPAADVPGLRSLGTNWNQASAGNDSRFTNATAGSILSTVRVVGSVSTGAVLTATTSTSASFSSVAGVPTGTVLDYAGATAPSGYFICDGRSFTNTDYPALALVLTNIFGPWVTNAGIIKIPLPDLRGRVAAGLDNMGANGLAGRLAIGTNGVAIGLQTGSITVAVTNQVLNVNSTTGPQYAYAGTGTNDTPIIRLTDSFGNKGMGGGQTNSAAYSNVQPTMGINKIIKN